MNVPMLFLSYNYSIKIDFVGILDLMFAIQTFSGSGSLLKM